MKVKSYEGTSSTGIIREMIGLSKSIEGRDVIVIEDIVDTGHTLHYIKEELEKMSPASLAFTTLLHKPEAFEHNYVLDYIGFEIPNKFIVGYGLDYDGYGRNLKEIYQII
jgi:hypoxanthine phosphoribosyltransferase